MPSNEIRLAMIDCEHLDSGQCLVASFMAGAPAVAAESTCKACQADQNPMTNNKPTCGLAIVALVKANLFDPNKHSGIVNCAKHAAPKGGVGDELEKLLSWVFSPDKECKCKSRAAAMNAWGPDGCEERMDRILYWLRRAANKKGIPFNETIVTGVVRRAIANARRNAARSVHNQLGLQDR